MLLILLISFTTTVGLPLLEGMTPLGYAAEPEDHVPLYAMLACRESSKYMTGTTVLSDGGLGVG